jgi:hypothetical protein
MRMTIDGVSYSFSVGKIVEAIRTKYMLSIGQEEVKLTMPNGKKIDFGKKSLLRIGIKSLLVPILLPMLTDAYEKAELTLPEHEKHSDYIDYIVLNALAYIVETERNIDIHATSTPDITSNVRHVTSISASRREPIANDGEYTLGEQYDVASTINES